MDALWLTGISVFPRATCLGLGLSPLSLGHVFLLYEFGSPFITGGQVGPMDIVLSAFICAEPYDRSIKNLRSPLRKAFFRLMLFRFFVWRRRWDWAKEIAAFKGYFEEGFSVPKVKHPLESGPSIEAPLPYVILAGALSELSMSHAEAMNLPLAHLNRLQLTLSAAKGRVDFESDSDRELWEAAKKNDQEAIARGEL
jgi:hypothetical protein